MCTDAVRELANVDMFFNQGKIIYCTIVSYYFKMLHTFFLYMLVLTEIITSAEGFAVTPLLTDIALLSITC